MSEWLKKISVTFLDFGQSNGTISVLTVCLIAQPLIPRFRCSLVPLPTSPSYFHRLPFPNIPSSYLRSSPSYSHTPQPFLTISSLTPHQNFNFLMVVNLLPQPLSNTSFPSFIPLLSSRTHLLHTFSAKLLSSLSFFTCYF